MHNEITLGKIVNKNDNHSSSWLQMGYPNLNAACAPFIPLADWLIAKHCQQWWKNQPQTSQYQQSQFGLCSTLWYPRHTKEWTCRFLAIDLGCSPLSMMNDPETLDRIPELMPEHAARAMEVINLVEIK